MPVAVFTGIDLLQPIHQHSGIKEVIGFCRRINGLIGLSKGSGVVRFSEVKYDSIIGGTIDSFTLGFHCLLFHVICDWSEGYDSRSPRPPV